MFLTMNDRSPIADRIEALMNSTGMSKAEVIRRSGVNKAYLTDLFSGKSKEPRISNVEKIARALGCTTSELWDGKKTEPQQDVAYLKKSHMDGTYGLIQIPEFDVQAAAGSGLMVPDLQDASKVWTLPRSALEGVRATSLNNLAIITVAGESMMPDYMPGEKILVDVGDCIVSHDGAYIIHNRYGLVVKMVQIISGPTAEEDVLRIISKNPDYSPYDQPVRDVTIQGRVVGKWVWK